MPSVDKKEDMRKAFPGDEILPAPQRIHLARRLLLAAAKRKRVIPAACVRPLKLRSKRSTRAWWQAFDCPANDAACCLESLALSGEIVSAMANPGW